MKDCWPRMNQSVLIIEDEKGIRKSLESFLKDYGYTVFSAENSHQALDLAKKTRIDFVILDLGLKDSRGEGLIHELKALYPELKFIIHTGSIDFVLTDDMKNAGIQEGNIVFKPQLDLKHFLKIIRSF